MSKGLKKTSKPKKSASKVVPSKGSASKKAGVSAVKKSDLYFGGLKKTKIDLRIGATANWVP